jgi:hypothetical protein
LSIDVFRHLKYIFANYFSSNLFIALWKQPRKKFTRINFRCGLPWQVLSWHFQD